MGKLFAIIVTIITIVSAAIFILFHWMPPDVSQLGVGIDHQMAETLITSGILFV
ncbi:MAG: hypothetical protein QOH22_615, partial [Gemmatimonadaceae bacterium]|nr:hypothetical protein [Gemmatimonadaceae bacterium]